LNPYSGFVHLVKLYGTAYGPLRSTKPKRPAGMSGRQWKRMRKAQGLTTKSAGFTLMNRKEVAA